MVVEPTTVSANAVSNKRNMFTADPINIALNDNSKDDPNDNPKGNASILCPAYFLSLGEHLMMHRGSWTAPQSTSSCTVIPSAPSLSAYDSAAFGVGLNANTEETEFKSHRKWLEEHEAALNAVSHEITDYFPDIAPSPKSSAPPQRVCDGQSTSMGTRCAFKCEVCSLSIPFSTIICVIDQ